MAAEKKPNLDSMDLALASTPQALFKQIFDAEHPEQFTRQIPSQVLYLAIREQGLPSSADVLDLLSPEQLRTVLDFDLWTRDIVEEDRIWEWLELPDANDDLQILQRLLQCVDLKVIALLISRYVEVVIPDEASDSPPGDGFHSPDKGQSWIRVTHEDSNREFLMKRLLALIFETKIELYYQLLQIPLVTTESTLEEQGYTEKTKRLLAEGIPSDEWAAELQAATLLADAMQKLQKADGLAPMVEDIRSVPAFVKAHALPSPLREFFAAVGRNEDLEREITLLMNSALVHFRIPWWETDRVRFLMEQVRGASNIGLERILESSPSSSFESVFEVLGYRGMYQVGLESLFALRRRAQKIDEEACQGDPRLLRLLDALSGHFPSLPAYVEDDGSLSGDGEKLTPGFRPLERLSDVNVSEVLLAQLER